MSRGALLVLEGCDRAGKSTQVKRLVQALNDLGIPAEERRFPGGLINEFEFLLNILESKGDGGIFERTFFVEENESFKKGLYDRKTKIGTVIDEFLSHKTELPPETIHLLFSANRWECVPHMKKTLEAGTTLVVDRYAASGAAYSAVLTKKSLSWCKEPDRGLPAPDFVALLAIDEDSQTTRNGWGNERFEKQDFQRKVAENFLKLKDDTWQMIQANQSVDSVHNILLNEALKIIEKVKSESIKELYQL